jgi:hypothetical protein
MSSVFLSGSNARRKGSILPDKGLECGFVGRRVTRVLAPDFTMISAESAIVEFENRP